METMFDPSSTVISVGLGATPKATMDTYLAQPRLEAGVPNGFVRRNVYFWKAAGAPNAKKNGSK